MFSKDSVLNRAATAAPPPVTPAEKVKKESNLQLKNWCCTIYPDTFTTIEECYETVQAIGADAKWAIFGLETCPTTKRQHLQGYVSFNERIRFTALRKKYFPTIHWEGAKGTASQNYEYCTKEDPSPLEFGDRPQFEDAGEREKERWKRARVAATTNNLDDVPDQIYVQHYKSIKAIAFDNMLASQTLEELDNYWLWGVPNSGKSFKARNHWGDDLRTDVYIKGANKWWDGYNNQPTVVIEDLDPTHGYLADRIKCWADKYPFTCEVKGASAVLRPKRLVITSNYRIEDIFPNLVDQQAIKRRFKVEHFPFPYGRSDPETQELPPASVNFVPATPPPSSSDTPPPAPKLVRQRTVFIKPGAKKHGVTNHEFVEISSDDDESETESD